jgi:DNA-binding response OmpR family regulator
MRRLLARQRSGRDIASFGGISIDAQKRSVAVGETPVQLGRKEFDILLLLVRAAGDAVTREQILDRVDDGSTIYDRTIDSHLSHLRRKLKDAGATLRIAAIYGVGYRLEAA